MSLEGIDKQFRLDTEVAPTFVVKNFNQETGEFEVWYNSPELKSDNMYGPIPMDLDSMKPDEEEPILMQIADMVFNFVSQKKVHEVDMSTSRLVLAQLMNKEQSVAAEELMRHRERMAKKDLTYVDPVVQSTTIVNVYNEDDFDLQFEALTQALAEEEAGA